MTDPLVVDRHAPTEMYLKRLDASGAIELLIDYPEPFDPTIYTVLRAGDDWVTSLDNGGQILEEHFGTHRAAAMSLLSAVAGYLIPQAGFHQGA